VQEVSTLQAAGIGALFLALAALLSLSLSVWVIRHTRSEPPHRAALGVAIAGALVLGVFFALSLSAHAASKVGVRAWVASERGTDDLVGMLDRATLQLTRGRAVLRVASVLVWAPLIASFVALWRAGVRGQRPRAAKIPVFVLLGSLVLGAMKVLSGAITDSAAATEAEAVVVPLIVADLRNELSQAAQDDRTCRRLEGATAIMGVPRVTAELPAAPETARTCVARRLRDGVSRETLRTSYLLRLAPSSLENP